MKVKELIKELQKCNQEAEVMIDMDLEILPANSLLGTDDEDFWDGDTFDVSVANYIMVKYQ